MDANSSSNEERDPFGPPAEPCECWCMHCQRTFMSDGIWYQKVISTKDGSETGGFWMCPTPNCGGAGFTFDIFPTDPDHPANEGWHSFDDDDDEDDDEWDEEDGQEHGEEVESEPREYDPDEPQFAELDEMYGDDDDDIEGEEWKHGLKPGELPPESPAMASGRREREEEEKKYDMPDERPRIIYENPDDRPKPPSGVGEDDIPF